MGAVDATLTEALVVLRGAWARVMSNVLRDRAVLWIGSAVSREKLPPLHDLLLLLFNRLHDAQDPTNVNCPYQEVERQVIALSTVTGLDITQAPAAWPHTQREQLLNQLTDKYADVFEIHLQIGAAAQDLPWEFLKLHEVYSDKTITPDAEHRFLALLMAEGAVSQVITTNWDPLIERAYAALACRPALQVVACNAELNLLGFGSVVFKIHGCADAMRGDPPRYKHNMVVSRDDINRWTSREFFQPFREGVRTLLRAKQAVFIGISGQDFNLQAQCVTAAIGDVTYPVDPPRIVFTVTEIGAPQRAILQGLYGADYPANAATINNGAALPLYGKPLLGALFVQLLIEKLSCLLDMGDDQFPSNEFVVLSRHGIVMLEQFLTSRYDAVVDPIDRWRTLALEAPAFIARLLSLYRTQQVPATTSTYQPLDHNHIDWMRADQNLLAANLHWLILAASLFMEGQARGSWTLSAPALSTGEDGQLRVGVAATNEVVIFFVSRADTGQYKLQHSGALRVSSGRRVLLIYPAGTEPARTRRSPVRSFPGAASRALVSEIWLEDLANQTLTVDVLLDTIRSLLIAATPI